MDDPYIPPEHGQKSDPPDSSKQGCTPPVIGCGVGGCLVPILLFLACAIFLSDTGGPLIWPIIALPLGITGMVAGFIYKASK